MFKHFKFSKFLSQKMKIFTFSTLADFARYNFRHDNFFDDNNFLLNSSAKEENSSYL